MLVKARKTSITSQRYYLLALEPSFLLTFNWVKRRIRFFFRIQHKLLGGVCAR